MPPPIPGIAPPELGEVVSMTVWPSIAAFRLGRLVGQLAGLQWGFGFFTLGKLFALLTIPLSFALFAWKLLPFVSRRYRLTNRRIVVQKGLLAVEERAIGLDEFDAIQVAPLPGQAWLRAADVMFLKDDREVFRLSGVPNPETFRRICLKARSAYLAVHAVLEREAI